MTSAEEHERSGSMGGAVPLPGEWQYSVKIETNAKGWIQPSIHVYSNDMKLALQQTISALNCLVADLRDNGFRVATDIRNGTGSGNSNNEVR